MKIIMKDYNLDSFQDKDIYSWDEIIGIIQELEYDKKRLEDEVKELKDDIEYNYRPISIAEQVGISDKDFI